MSDKVRILVLLFIFTLSLSPSSSHPQSSISPEQQAIAETMLDLLEEGTKKQREACETLAQFGSIEVLPALIDAIFFVKVPVEWERAVEHLTGRNFGRDWTRWMEWLGKQDLQPHPAYGAFKQQLFGRIDPAFSLFLSPESERTIRLDEVVWGGVRKDGIPALDNPKMISGSEANYLNDDDHVFGLSVNGETQAYPLRIMNWHEMLNIKISGKAIALTYCTLCGAAVPYESEIDGKTYTFGSSGLLYRSNKLMYDRQTHSLWSSLEGKPVVGPLVGKGIQLQRHYVVRTTWKEWRESNPKTLVLDISTGFERDYSPDMAYREYFDSKETMFPVAWRDQRLGAKDWVFGLMLNGKRKAYPLKKLKKNRLLHDKFTGESILLIVDAENLSVRAFERKNHRFKKKLDSGKLADQNGNYWTITEDVLIREIDQEKLYRLPGHLAYWFGWYAFFPETEVWE